MPANQKKKTTPVAEKKPVATKGGVQKKSTKKTRVNKSDRPIFGKAPKNFGIGGDLQPPRDLTRYVRWPKYIRLQRQKQVLMKRLKVPPAVNQFTHTLNKSDAKTLLTLLDKYRPETKAQKHKRLVEQAKAGPEATPTEKPLVVKYGLNHVTNLVESKKAKLVVIPHDVDPLELVLWLPTLCRKKDVPYVIIKGKSRLGKVVHKKTASVLAVTDVATKDQATLKLLIERAKDSFNGRYPVAMKTYGGKTMGFKHRMALGIAEKKRLRKESGK